MIKVYSICDECGEKEATFIYAGGNPIPTSLILSNQHGNQGFILCDDCQEKDPVNWRNIHFAPRYLDTIRKVIRNKKEWVKSERR